MARTNGPIEVWNRDDTAPTDAQGGYAGGDSTAAAVGTSLDQSSRALGTVDNLVVTAQTLDYGQEATATISGASPWKTIDIGIPKGMPDTVGAQLVADSQTTTAAAQQAAADAQTALAAQFMTQDEGVATLISDDVAGASTRAALTGPNSPVVGKGDLLLNVRDFGAIGDGVADDTAAITAAINATPTSGVVYYPDCSPGYYRITSPLPSKGYVTHRGDGRGSTLRVVTGSMWVPTAVVYSMWVQDVTLETTGSHVFDIAAGGLSLSGMNRVRTIQYADAASLVRVSGSAQFIDNTFTNCDYNRNGATTNAPVFDITNDNGGIGSNRWEKSRVTTATAATATSYVWVIRQTGPAYAYENVIRDITGEHNAGGLIDAYSAYGLTVENVVDNDVYGEYTSSIVRVGRTTTGGYSGNVRLSNVGNRGGTLGATAYHFEATAPMASLPILDRVGDHTGGDARVKMPQSYNTITLNASGATGALVVRNWTGALNPTRDGALVLDGSSLGVTMPAVASVTSGREFRVKNIHATSATVSTPDGATIDGAATLTLAQWESARLVSTGTSWVLL